MAEANQEKTNLKLEVSYVLLTLLFDFIKWCIKEMSFFPLQFLRKHFSLTTCQVYICIP